MNTREQPSLKDFINLLCITHSIDLNDFPDYDTLRKEFMRELDLAIAKGWIKEVEE